MDIDAIETKLTAARAKLILDKPFLGALVLRLPMAAADPNWCATTATDARRFYYNPEYIDSLSMSQTQFMLAHEALHCALSHFARRQHRVQHRWDLACDYAINPLKESFSEKVLDLTHGMGADLYLEATGLPTIVYPEIEQTIWLGRTLNATVVVLARADAKMPVTGEVLQVRRASIVGSQGHSGHGTFPGSSSAWPMAWI